MTFLTMSTMKTTYYHYYYDSYDSCDFPDSMDYKDYHDNYDYLNCQDFYNSYITKLCVCPMIATAVPWLPYHDIFRYHHGYRDRWESPECHTVLTDVCQPKTSQFKSPNKGAEAQFAQQQCTQ